MSQLVVCKYFNESQIMRILQKLKFHPCLFDHKAFTVMSQKTKFCELTVISCRVLKLSTQKYCRWLIIDICFTNAMAHIFITVIWLILSYILCFMINGQPTTNHSFGHPATQIQEFPIFSFVEQSKIIFTTQH